MNTILTKPSVLGDSVSQPAPVDSHSRTPKQLNKSCTLKTRSFDIPGSTSQKCFEFAPGWLNAGYIPQEETGCVDEKGTVDGVSVNLQATTGRLCSINPCSHNPIQPELRRFGQVTVTAPQVNGTHFYDIFLKFYNIFDSPMDKLRAVESE